MANVREAKYTVQLGPTVTPEVAGELYAWAELLGMSNSAVIREVIEAGLLAKARSFALRAELTSPDLREAAPDVLRENIEHCSQRGKTQTRRRRDYDAATRGTGAPAINGVA